MTHIRMDKVKVLLINPPLDNMLEMEMSKNIINSMGVYPPLGLLYIASFVKEMANFAAEIKILDCPAERLSYENLAKEIEAFLPTVLGVTTSTPTIIDSILTTRLAKEIKPDIKTVLGGHHTYCYSREALLEPSVDFAVRGEGEESFLQLLSCIMQDKPPYGVDGVGFRDNGVIKLNEKVAVINNLDMLPMPDRAMLARNKYKCLIGSQNQVATVISSRGCPYECIFCYSPQKMYRSRSAKNILREIKYIINLGINEIFFFDELFNISPGRVIEIAKAIISENLNIKWGFRGRVDKITDEMLEIAKKSGCSRIHLGIETGSNRFLEILKKNTNIDEVKNAVALIRKHKIITVGSFMIGLPGEDRGHILQSFEFARQLKLDYIEIGILVAYPQTRLYRDYLESEAGDVDPWLELAKNPLENRKHFTPPVYSDKLSRNDLNSLMDIGYRRFYINPEYIFRSLLKIKNATLLLNKIRGAYFIWKEFKSKQS